MIDLHTHSTYSDGTLTPAELVELSVRNGLSAVALCDHNTVAGLKEFLEAAKNAPVTPVPGVEFSTDYEGTELHILALFVQPEDYAPITALLEQMLQAKEQSNIGLIRALKPAGIDLDFGSIKAGTPNAQVNRAVIAAEMVRKGYCRSVKEAFSQWLSPKQGFYVPPKRLDVFEVIRFIRSLGAVAILAHPFLNLDEARLRVFLKEARNCGLDGMEVYYPLFDKEKTALAEEIAEEYGLLKSGGSDFHGENKPDISLGTGKGNIQICDDILVKLQLQNVENKMPR